MIIAAFGLGFLFGVCIAIIVWVFWDSSKMQSQSDKDDHISMVRSELRRQAVIKLWNGYLSSRNDNL